VEGPGDCSQGPFACAILVPMETFLTLGLAGFVIVGVILGLAAIVAMIKAPYGK